MSHSPELGSPSRSSSHRSVSDSQSYVPTMSKSPPNSDHQEHRLGFMDLPPEIRNMIYHLALAKDRYWPQLAENDRPYWFSKEEETRMMKDWLPPPLAHANKQIGQESIPVYYSTNSFDLYWQPDRPYCYLRPELRRERSEGVLKKFVRCMHYLQQHNLQMAEVIVRGHVERNHTWVPSSTEPLIDFIQVMSPFVRPVVAVDKGQSVQPNRTLPTISFEHQLGWLSMFLDIAFDLDPGQILNRKYIDLEITSRFLHDPFGWFLLQRIREARSRYMRSRRDEIWRTKKENADKGKERWTGVLRDRTARQEAAKKAEAEKTAHENQNRWNRCLRSRKSKRVGQ